MPPRIGINRGQTDTPAAVLPAKTRAVTGSELPCGGGARDGAPAGGNPPSAPSLLQTFQLDRVQRMSTGKLFFCNRLITNIIKRTKFLSQSRKPLLTTNQNFFARPLPSIEPHANVSAHANTLAHGVIINSMKYELHSSLGRRERQILEALYKIGRGSVAAVRAELPDPPSYSAVRAMLTFLEGKGFVAHEQTGIRYTYFPTIAQTEARQSALRHLVATFFHGSPVMAAATLLSMPTATMPDEDRALLAELISRAKTEGR